MNKSVLNIEVQDFINNNINVDVTKLLFKNSSFPKVSTKELVIQIEGKNKCKNKLPTWFNTANIYYPKKVNIEQTSSETTAKYKSDLLSGSTLIDITGGFGVDSYYFSRKFESVIHCEINKELHDIVSHNFKQLQTNGIKTVQHDGISYLKTIDKCDWIYIDPSRRHETKGKVYFLVDCLPNVPEHLELFLSKASSILVKTSPLLDIKAGLKSLNHVKEIHCVAVNNDMKELLWFIDKEYKGDVSLKALNIKNKGIEFFESNFEIEKNSAVNYSKPLKYLYEPNAAIMKLGAFNSISTTFDIHKLDYNTHLYTSNDCKVNFPGRKFEVLNVLNFNKRALKAFVNTKANITTRNFSLSVSQIKNKFKIKDGGNSYLFFTTINNEKQVIITKKC